MDWQTLIVLLLVASAASWIGYRFFRSLQTSQSGCGTGCGSCARQWTNSSESSSPPLVSLDSLQNSAQVLDRSSPMAGARHS